MTINTNQDQVIRELYYKVQEKKAEVETVSSKPNWVTNCAFRYDNKPNDIFNIQTINDLDTLVHIAGWLTYEEDLYNKGLKVLGLPEKQYTWLTYTPEQWIKDINTRINKINLVDKKVELRVLESRLKKILPPEFERQLELEAIMQSDSLK
jgi:hypothetical protein